MTLGGDPKTRSRPKARSSIVEGRVPADAAATSRMIGAAEDFAACAGLSATAAARPRIVVEEVFTNAVGHGGPPAGRLHLGIPAE